MMDFEDYLELGAITTTIAPDEEIPEYDPYIEDEMAIEDYMVETWRLEAQLSNLLGEEVKL